MPIERRDQEVLAGSFPPTLVSNVPEIYLKPNETPSATGIDVLAEGFLSTGAIPSGTTRTVKTYTISAVDWELHYNRLFRISGNVLYFNAPRYTDVVLPQGLGQKTFPEDTNSFLKIMPVGTSGLVLFKASGAHVVFNASSSGDRFETSDLIQEATITVGTYCAELDGVVYFVNSVGLFSIDSSGKVTELSFQYRNNITPSAITVDYVRKLVVIGTTHAYDVNNKKIFKYSGTAFNYKSRALKSSSDAPFSVNEIGFVITRTDTTDGEIKFKTRMEKRDWSQEYKPRVPYQRGTHEYVFDKIDPDTGRSFQIEITSLDSSIKVKQINVGVSDYSIESRDS